MQTQETFLPILLPEGQFVDGKPVIENTPQETPANGTLHIPPATPNAQASASPLADIWGKYEGEEWNEFRAILKKNRQCDDSEAG